MMLYVLLQADRLTEFQRAVRHEFESGATVTRVLLVLAAAVALILLAYWLLVMERRKETPDEHQNSEQLFRDLLHKLALPPPQRHLLETVAQELHLKHPAVLLLSEALFDRFVAEWQARRERRTGGNGDPAEAQIAARTRARLFPQVLARVSSSSALAVGRPPG